MTIEIGHAFIIAVAAGWTIGTGLQMIYHSEISSGVPLIIAAFTQVIILHKSQFLKLEEDV